MCRVGIQTTTTRDAVAVAVVTSVGRGSPLCLYAFPFQATDTFIATDTAYLGGIHGSTLGHC